MQGASASGTVLGVVDTLARRIDQEGPLAAKDAVRLVARMARAVERLHAGGRVHGKLGPHAVTIPGQDLADAWVASATACTPDPAYHSPERRAGGGPSVADDIYAMALTLFFALTGWRDEVLTGSTTRPPPLAVFDAGDDQLESILDAALGDRSSRPKTLAKFRAALDKWLERDGAPSGEPLDIGPRAQRAVPPPKMALDIGALPPPPPPSAPAPKVEPVKGAPLFEVQDEDSTWRQPEVRETSRVARAPKLVPPKLASKMPPRPAAPAGQDAVDEDEARPTLPFDGDIRRLPALSAAAADEGANAEAAKPVAGRRARKPSVVVVVVGTAVVVAGGWVLLRGSSTSTSTTTATATSTDTSTDTSTSPSPSPSPSTSTSTSTSPSPSTTTPTTTSTTMPSVAAAPSMAPSADEAPAPTSSARTDKRKHTAPGACLEGLFAEDSFGEEGVEGALDFVCKEANPIKGAPRVREVLVREGRGKVTGGMKEWAVLGFYELAAYAVLRDRCCSSKAPPLELPTSPGSCAPLVDSLGEVARASRPGSDPKGVGPAVDHFDDAVRCITRSKQTKLFGGYPRPSGGEGTALKKTMARARGEPK